MNTKERCVRRGLQHRSSVFLGMSGSMTAEIQARSASKWVSAGGTAVSAVASLPVPCRLYLLPARCVNQAIAEKSSVGNRFAADVCFRGAKADNHRQAFTLMELLLVLAILIVVGAIITPAIFGPLQNQKLHSSADLIRAEWSEARVNAMRTGLIHVFQYQPDTGNYIVKPWMAEADFLEGNPLETPLGNTPGESAYEAYSAWEQLPERVIFIQGNSESDLRWQMHLAEEGAENLTDSSLSPPIVFYPDGTTSNAQVWLSLEEKKYFISIQMRGMTGLSRIGPLMSAEEMQ